MSYYRYFVEGECEKKLLRTFMFIDGDSFIDGKIDIINFINEKITRAFARTIKENTTVVIVHDTDVKNINILEYNINLLLTVSKLSPENIIIVQSIKTLEDELVYSCDKIKDINQLLSTKGLSEFKKKFITHSDLLSKLISAGFSIKKIWSRQAPHPFDVFINESHRIKRVKKNK